MGARRFGGVKKTRNATYLLDLDREEATWINSQLKTFIRYHQSGADFYRFRGRNATVLAQRFANKRGRFLEISKFISKGKRQNIIVPSGFQGLGWTRISDILTKLLSGNAQLVEQQPASHGHNKIRDTDFQQRVSKKEWVYEQEMKQSKEEVGWNFTQKDWNEAIIITKGRVNISWKQVEMLLGQDVKRRIEVHPFQANKAVWWPDSQKDFSTFISLKRGFFDFGVTLDFEVWRPNINAADSVIKCCNSWIKILGLPWNQWSLENFRLIGAKFGGLLQVSEDTRRFRDLGAAKIKVKGTKDGFINNKIMIPFNGVNVELTIITQTFDSKAFESFEKKTYAQALINGKKKAVAWTFSNTGRIMDNNGTSTNILKESSEKVNDLQYKLREEAGKSALPSVHQIANKAEKILHRITAKPIEEFQRSPVLSLSDSDDKELGSSEYDIGQSSTYHMNRQINCRKSKNVTIEDPEVTEAGGSVLANDLIRNANTNTDSNQSREFLFEDLEDTILSDTEEEFLDEEFDATETGSHASSQSDQLVNNEPSSMDIKGLFDAEDGNQQLYQHSILDNPNPLVGKVLSSLHSPSLSFSFTFNSSILRLPITWGCRLGSWGGNRGQSSVMIKCGSEGNTSICYEKEIKSNVVGVLRQGISRSSGAIELGLSPSKMSRELARLKCGINYDKGSSAKGSVRCL